VTVINSIETYKYKTIQSSLVITLK